MIALPEYALTVRQPWASLIIVGAKDIENRNWPTNRRGRIAIHSSSSLLKEEMDAACEVMEGFIPKFSRRIFRKDHFPTGCILGSVEITDCVRSSESPWFFGEYGFVLRHPDQLEVPVPCRGALGFWRIPDEMRKAAA